MEGMVHRNRFRFVVFALVGVAVAACSDSPTGPGSSTLDLKALLAEMSTPSIGAATSFATAAAGPMTVAAPSVDPGQCTYTADTGFFVCPTLTSNGLTITRMYRLIDAAGNSQSQLNGQTSAIETKTTVKGTPPPPSQFSRNSSITLDGASDMTLSGIRTGKHTLNGVSVTTMTGSFDLNGTSIPINSTVTQTTTNLVLPNASAGQQWPQSGTMSFDETSNVLSTGLGPATSMHLVMTFNGTSIVTVTITDALGTSTCHFDMANPGVGAGSCS
jgi:hypothetical protein